MSKIKHIENKKGSPAVLISYDRHTDLKIVKHLRNLLYKYELNSWIDTQDIPYGENWRSLICEAVKNAVAVIFLISPESIASKHCNDELNLASEYGKKIIPIMIRHTSNMHPAMQELHYFELLDDTTFEDIESDLLVALKSNWNWNIQHTQLLNKAMEYNNAPIDKRYESLLSKYELYEVDKWVMSAGREQDNRIIPIIRQFLYESRKSCLQDEQAIFGYARRLSDDLKSGNSELNENTLEIAELPMMERVGVYSEVIRNAIRDGYARTGNDFFYLVEDLPKALNFQKSHWDLFIKTALLDELSHYHIIYYLIADNIISFKSFCSACDSTVLSGQYAGPVSHPIRTANMALFLQKHKKNGSNLDLVDRLYKHAYSRAQQIIALLPVDTVLEKAQADALKEDEDNAIAFISTEMFEKYNRALNSAYIIFHDILDSLETYHNREDLFNRFNSDQCLHLLGRLAVLFARNRHWGTAYEICRYLCDKPFDKISASEIFDWRVYYKKIAYEENIRNSRRRRYARKKCLEVLTILHAKEAPTLWTAVLARCLGIKNVFHQLENLKSTDRRLERDKNNTFSKSILKNPLAGNNQFFGIH